MSALRLSTPTDGVRLLDLGPCPWVPIYGTATMRGHAVASGRIARPAPTPEPAAVTRRARMAANSRAYRARRRQAA